LLTNIIGRLRNFYEIRYACQRLYLLEYGRSKYWGKAISVMSFEYRVK
jgi:hypothetical protein